MPSKPNYNYQRAERDRAKKASKAVKQQERKEQAVIRKALPSAETVPGDATSQEPGE